jgi:hypothetical protein
MSYANADLRCGEIFIVTHRGSFVIQRGEAVILIAQLADCLAGGFAQRDRQVIVDVANGCELSVDEASGLVNDRADWVYDDA